MSPSKSIFFIDALPWGSRQLKLNKLLSYKIFVTDLTPEFRKIIIMAMGSFLFAKKCVSSDMYLRKLG